MCEFHDCNCNGLGDIWWTDKCMYFSSIDSIQSLTTPYRGRVNSIIILTETPTARELLDEELRMWGQVHLFPDKWCLNCS